MATDEHILALWMFADNGCSLSDFDSEMISLDNFIQKMLYRSDQFHEWRYLIYKDHSMRLGYFASKVFPKIIHFGSIRRENRNAHDVLLWIEDPWCFAPTKEYIMMIYARYWYENNKDQFE